MKLFGLAITICCMLRTVKAITVIQKALILTTSSNLNADAAKYTLNSYGFPFDVITVDIPSFNGTLELESEPGSGRYSLMILTSDSLAYLKDGAWVSGLSDSQFQQLAKYQVDYSIRQVVFNAWPTPSKHYSVVQDQSQPGCCFVEQWATFTSSSPIEAAGLKSTAKLSTLGLYHYPAVITDTARAKSILTFQGGPPTTFTFDTVGGVLVTHDDGREEMVFFMSFGSWSTTTLLLGHMWMSWGTRGIYHGSRHIFLNAQVDDFFLDTNIISIPGVKNYSYRTSPNDMQQLHSWTVDLASRLPLGSNFTVELAFNGNGIISAGSPGTALDIDTNGYVGLNFKKPPGIGDNRWPNPVPSDTVLGLADLTIANLDPLFRYFTGTNITNQEHFLWLSHTYTHENLNNVSYRDVDMEVKTNEKVARNLLNMIDKLYYSPHSLVTPQISGVFNSDALQAFLDNNITSIVGDNSRSNLISPNGLWYPLITTQQLSNFDGYVILPRASCEIYYHCSTVEENTFAYNSVYQSILGVSTFQDILNRESSRVLYKLLSLHIDGYMFHQANLRASDTVVTVGTGTGKLGLLQQWVESVAAKVSEFTNWPIRTLKQDDLAVMFLKRLDRLNCGLETKLVYDETGSKIGLIEITSKQACEIPLTIPTDVIRVDITDEVFEKVGNQPLVVHVPMIPGVVRKVTLSDPITVRSA